MARSNTANGGSSYFDLVFQLVSDTETYQVVRAVVYLTSLNVNDSTNAFDVWGDGYSRGGAIGLAGTYNATPVWFQDTQHHKAIGATRQIGVGARFTNVNYWGTTLEAIEYYTIPARYEKPSSPATAVAGITPTSAQIHVTAPTYNGGAPIDRNEAYVLTNNAWPGSGGNVVASSGTGGFVANDLLPGTRYFYTARSRNTAGYWSDWTPMKAFNTLPAAMVKSGGSWKNALVYVKHSGSWKLATPYVKVSGTWKLA